MKLISNTGTDRVIDLIRSELEAGYQLDLLTSEFSLFAFAELIDEMNQLSRCRLILPPVGDDLRLLGAPRIGPGATGEENLMEHQSGYQMNELEYRRKQLLKLQDAVIDLEDLSTGVSITDLTFTDFRIDLAQYRSAHLRELEKLPWGLFAVTDSSEAAIAPGIIFCLRAEGATARRPAEDGYPLAPYYLVYVNEAGEVLLPCTRGRQILEFLKRLCAGRDLPDAASCALFDRKTRDGADTQPACQLLAAAVAAIVGKRTERAIESLFVPGGTVALKGEFAGIQDFEVLAFLVVTPEGSTE